MATDSIGVWGEKYEVEEPIVETPAPETPETPVEVTTEVTPPVVEQEPLVETPAAIEEPPAEAPTDEPEAKEVIKEVEKIVEKYPEMDEHTQTIFEALMNGEEDKILNYLSEKHKNYATMSDFDVVVENLKKTNPTWSKDEIDVELRYKYGQNLERIDISEIDKDLDPQGYSDALKHNREVEANEIALKRDARDARHTLETLKKEIKLPKIQKEETPQPVQPTAEQIEQGRRDWEAIVDKGMPELKDFSFKVGDDDIGYKITDEQRKEQANFLKAMDSPIPLFKRLGWIDDNGVQNISKIAGDVIKLENLSQILSSVHTSGKTAGAKGTVEEIKNIDLSKNPSPSVEATAPDIGAAVWGHINPK